MQQQLRGSWCDRHARSLSLLCILRRQLSFAFTLGGVNGTSRRRLLQPDPGFECSLQLFNSSSGDFSNATFSPCTSPAVCSPTQAQWDVFDCDLLGSATASCSQVAGWWTQSPTRASSKA